MAEHIDGTISYMQGNVYRGTHSTAAEAHISQVPSQVIIISTSIAKGEGFCSFGINTIDTLIHVSNICYI
jgi:hypothetical protein